MIFCLGLIHMLLGDSIRIYKKAIMWMQEVRKKWMILDFPGLGQFNL